MKTSSYNLIMSAMFNGRKGDRPPVGNPSSIVCHDLMDAAGVSFPDAHLDALSILRRRVGGKVAIVGKVMGPWTLSYHMAGTQNFLLQIGMGETKKVIKMLKQLMPVTIAVEAAHKGY